MPICKKCGTEYDSSLDACPTCGEPTERNEETFDMYQELLNSSDTKEFSLLPEDSEEFTEDIGPDENIPEEPAVEEDDISESEMREQTVREMFAEEPEEPSFIEKVKTSLLSLFASRKKEGHEEAPSDTGLANSTEIVETDSEAVSEELPVPQPDDPDETLIETTIENTNSDVEEADLETALPEETPDDESDLFDEILSDGSVLEEEPIPEVFDSEEIEEQPVSVSNQEEPSPITEGSTETENEDEDLEKEEESKDETPAESEPSETPSTTVFHADTDTDSAGETSSDKENRNKLLKKKGLSRPIVLSLALIAILAVLGVVFLWILPQKQAEQQAIEAQENAYLDFLCDTWMSDVFIYAEETHPSREVLTLTKDLHYHCDIWTSSSDREAFDPDIWSITDTNDGTYYLELDTASIRVYYTGEDGQEYVYRRYIRELTEDTLILREYYNENLSEYYDVTFTKYEE